MTVLARKYKLTLIVVGIILCLAAGFAYQARQQHIVLNGNRFSSEIMDTNQLRQKGLSGRSNIGQDNAMIFVFDDTARHCFWMKDMKFNIDMVWLDAGNKVVAIEKRVSPGSYPTSYCHNGTKVIELAAGTTERIKLRVGDHIDL